MSANGWNELRYSELMQTYRLLSTQVTQYNLGLTIALVTVIGFAIDRESWGLASLGLVLEALMLFTVEVHRRASIVVLDEAAAIEVDSPSAGTSTTDAMRAVMSGRHGSIIAIGERALVVVAAGHIAFVVFLAVALDWSFAGRP